VRVREARRYLNFATKALSANGRTKVLVKDLDCDFTLVSNVASEEDCRHSALTQLPFDIVLVGEGGF
jgi:hypothetical protein